MSNVKANGKYVTTSVDDRFVVTEIYSAFSAYTTFLDFYY